ncbi:hypothetical protein EPO33_01100 [Patescibacteria group bacterium]|nr:MAG: hypothetical protein EPO33_01100 [Patescibacteria group bacterium]
MTRKRKPTRAERKARTQERHEIVRSIMQEPDDIVHFPVAFGRIAMNAAVWGAVALGVLALGVLSSAVFLMRDEIAGLGKQLEQKDADLGILSGELQKVRDQMFGEQEETARQGITVQLVDAETGLLTSLGNLILKDTPYPLGPESRAVNGTYLYWTDEEGILRVNLEDVTSVRLVTKPFISSLAVSKDGTWLAYAYSQGLSDPESVGATRAVAVPLSGRGDPIELGELAGEERPIESMMRVVGFSADNKEVLWTEMYGDSGGVGTTLHRMRVANDQETAVVRYGTVGGVGPGEWEADFGLSPDGTAFAKLVVQPPEVLGNDVPSLVPLRIELVDAVSERERVRYTFPAQDRKPHRMVVEWSLDGSELVLVFDNDVYTIPVVGSGGPALVGKVTVPQDSDVRVAYLSDRFLFSLSPSLAGEYAFQNLATDAIASVDGPFTGIAGWSADLNAVVLLADTRE